MSQRPDLARAVSRQLQTMLLTLQRWPWLATAQTLWQRFREDRLGVTAGSLTFTTLIALVPLLTVMLAVFSAFPMFGRFQSALEGFLLQSLIPDAIAKPVLRALTQFAGKASQLGSAGLLVLLVTALALMLTIDRTLNAIWRVRRPRPLAQRVLVYWAALTLGPLALGVSLSLTSYALSASRGLVSTVPGGVRLLFDLVEFGLLAIALAGLYRYVPNTFVRWVHAWSGALFAALAFEGAKRGLAWYVDSIGTYSAVYGAFATAPILLLWIYLGWVIVLLGAVIAAYAPSLQRPTVRRADTPGSRFALAVAILAKLDQARCSAGTGLSLRDLSAGLGLDALQVEPTLDALMDLGWVGRLDEAGAQRHVLLVEPATEKARPLVESMLLAPAAETRQFAEHARLDDLTLAQLSRA